PVQNTEQALQIVQWYLWRWTIEQLFRTLKSKGLNMEKAEVESFHGLVNLATMALIAAVQVMQLVQARDGQTLQRIGDAFFEPEIQCLTALNTKVEGKTQKQKNPHPPNTLSFAAWIIARLGGWSGYQKDKPPGPITFIRGLNRFYNILEGYYLFR
ncbi:transposase, partial [Flavilitoribacter nigricans]